MIPVDSFGEAAAAREAAAYPKLASVDEYDVVARLLGRAFEDDPLMSWCFRADGRKAEAIQRFTRMVVAEQAGPLDGVMVAPDFNAAAIWLPPSATSARSPSVWRLVLGLPSLLGMTGLSRFTRPMALMRAMDAHHPPAPPHWYLYLLGVEPLLRGRGIGSALLAATLRRIDAERMPAYLDNSNAANTRLYERHGFRVVSEYRARPDAPPIWGMWRDAVP